MAKEYVVVHPVRHDGKGYNRSERIAASKLKEQEAARLLLAGVIGEPGVEAFIVKEVPVLLGESTLGKLNLEELTGYATARGITLREGLSKQEILSEISQAAQAGAELSEAQALANAQGR